MIRSFIALEGETLYDLVIRAYGDIRGLSELLRLNPDLDFTSTALPELVETEYFQVDLTPAVGKTLELSSIEFDIASRISSRPVRNFGLAYSLNSDFSSPTIIFDYPDGDIETTTISVPLVVNHTFDSVIVVPDSSTVYFRIYPYNAFNTTNPQMVIIRDTFVINGTIQGGSPTPSQLLLWPLNDSVSDSYHTFTFNAADILSANYTLAGTLDDVGTPFTSGGIWRFMPEFIEEVIDLITGTEIFYDDSITFPTIQNDVFIPKREYLNDYLVYDNQSIYDLAVQLYGDLGQGLKEILPLITAIENGSVPLGTLLPRKVPLNNIGEQFNDNNVLVATSPLFADDDTIIALEEGLEFALVG